MDDETGLLYRTTRVVVRKGLIVAYRAHELANGRRQKEQRTPIHIADIVRMTTRTLNHVVAWNKGKQYNDTPDNQIPLVCNTIESMVNYKPAAQEQMRRDRIVINDFYQNDLEQSCGSDLSNMSDQHIVTDAWKNHGDLLQWEVSHSEGPSKNEVEANVTNIPTAPSDVVTAGNRTNSTINQICCFIAYKNGNNTIRKVQKKRYIEKEFDRKRWKENKRK
jgi:hypothetical protein